MSIFQLQILINARKQVKLLKTNTATSQTPCTLAATSSNTQMTLAQRIVTKIPLDEIWTDTEILPYERQEYLTECQLQELVFKGDVAVAEASCGLKLSWVSPNSTFEFFKKKIKGHVVADADRIILEDYEDEWCYLASRWSDADGQKVILLETYH